MDREGAVRSVQAADLSMPAEELDAIWSPMHLERLARTYWKYLSRVTLGLIRVAYTNDRARGGPRDAPVRAPALPGPGVRDGRPARRRALAHPRRHPRRRARPRGRRLPAIGIERCAAGDDDPDAPRRTSRWRSRTSIRRSRAASAASCTRQTQSRIHVLVTHGFLRSLARLELEESAVGRFKDRGPGTGPVVVRPEPRPQRITGVRESRDGTVTVGDTPWAAIAALATGAALAAGLVVLARRR